nr:uncharacterized protein LOC119164467 [Rhipicephalus microplus]
MKVRRSSVESTPLMLIHSLNPPVLHSLTARLPSWCQSVSPKKLLVQLIAWTVIPRPVLVMHQLTARLLFWCQSASLKKSIARLIAWTAIFRPVLMQVTVM